MVTALLERELQPCLHHPFNAEMAAGILPRGKFDYFLFQDIRYLALLAKDLDGIAVALAAWPASSLPESVPHDFLNGVAARFRAFARGTLAYEQALQAELQEKYGIAQAQYPDSAVIDEYVGFTSSLLESGRLCEAVASHLPCFWIYYELGRRLTAVAADAGGEDAALYREWLASYAADEFGRDAADYLAICLELMTAFPEKSEAMAQAMVRSCGYERAFWDECYAYVAVADGAGDVSYMSDRNMFGNNGKFSGEGSGNALSDIGEFGFIRRFSPGFNDLLVGRNVLGIGDDCAIIGADADYDYLVSTDMLNEGVHFLLEDVDPVRLGYKSVAVNVSDIAAMGGEPVGTFLSLGIPGGVSLAFLDAFMEGYHRVSEEFSVPLLGGDTTRSLRDLAINVGVMGRVKKGKAVLRSGAMPGDVVCVTGFLGDSAGGLKLVLERRSKGFALADGDEEYLLDRHYRPSARVEQGAFLAAHGAHSMMDVSDGVASDLRHILRASGVAARVDLSLFPVSGALRNVASRYGWELDRLVSGGGEDYELLLTMSAGDFSACSADFMERFGIPLTVIGEIVPACGASVSDGNTFQNDVLPVGNIEWRRGDEVLSSDFMGFNHFRP